jgi:hypothetical protein
MNEAQTTLTAEEFELLLRKLLEEELKKPPIEEHPKTLVSDASQKRRDKRRFCKASLTEE